MIKIGKPIKNKISITKIKNKLLALDKKNKIKFIVLFGSVASGKSNPLSDIDVAVYYDGNDKQRFDFRLLGLSHLPDYVDLQIFQDLPLYLQNDVIKGKVIYYDNYDSTFNLFRSVIFQYDDCKQYMDMYYKMIDGENVGV